VSAGAIASRLDGLSPAQRALFELALRKKQAAEAARAAARAIPRRPPELANHCRLSLDQERFWILQQIDLESPIYNVYSATRFKGALKIPLLVAAINEIARRYETLRTTFPVLDGRPVQEIAPRFAVTIPVVDLRALPLDRREAAAESAANQTVGANFRVDRLPLLRLPLIRVHDEDFIQPICIHHIVTDRVSYDYLWSEMMTLYAAYEAGRPSPLPEPPMQFADFALWQRDRLAAGQLDPQLAYWKKQLAGAPEILPLPADRPRPARQTPWGARRKMVLTKAQSEGLRALAQREGATIFTAGLAVFKAFLARITGEERLVVGTPMDDRQGPQMQGAQGFFLNQLALYTDLSGNPPFREVMRRVKEVAVGAYANHELPFAQLVEVLQPSRDFSRYPYTQIVYLLIETPKLDRPESQTEVAPRSYWVDARRSQFDMTFALFWEEGTAVMGIWEANTDLFDDVTINRMKEQYRTLHSAILADPDRPLWDLPVLPEPQRHQLLHEWSASAAALPAGGALVPGRFAAQAAATPAAVAVEGAGRRLTYAGLARRAAALAARLRELGVGPETRVAVLLDRSPDGPAALLGALAAGGAVLPLDLAAEREWLQAALAAGRPAVLVTARALAGRVPAAGEGGAAVLLVDEVGEGEASAAAIAPAIDPEHTALLLPTAGGAAGPVLVELPHRALAALLSALAAAPATAAGGTWLAAVSPGAALPELLLPLLSGGRLVLADSAAAADGALLAAAIVAADAAVVQAAPAVLRRLADCGWQGRPGLRLIAGGEPLPRSLAARLAGHGVEVWSRFGAAEAGGVAAYGRFVPGRGPVPLGRPLPGVRAWLLDPHLQPVPTNTTGEVWLGGAGLARGYLGRPDLSAARFVPDPLSGEPGARLFRTGDLARHLADGRIDFVERGDRQIRWRGYRIDPRHVEEVLLEHPAVREAAVVVEGASGRRDLVAYVVAQAPDGPREQDFASDLRRHLQGRLPDPLIPAAWACVEALPLTPGGRVDRRALVAAAAKPRPVLGEGAEREEFVAPRTPLEERLVATCAEVLGTERVGVHDNFFALGGASREAARFVALLDERWGVEAPLIEVFEAATLAELAERIPAASHRGGVS
jgi:amino acid adenylation domain-containing protein